VFSLLLLNGDLLVVSNASGLGAAGDYFIVKRLFLVLSTLHFALLLPIWSEYTRAIEQGDHAWAGAALSRTACLTCLLFCLGGACLALAGRPVAFIWTGREIGDSGLFFWLAVWGLLYGWNNCFSVFLNAIGRLRRQVILVMAGAAAFFPLGIVLGRHWGATGICWALILVSLPAAFSNPIESFQALRGYAGCRNEVPDG
jgi:O-antigen/teichoic acid export membrane protein